MQKETNMAVASRMTCKICLIWRHIKTLYGAPNHPLPTGILKQSYATGHILLYLFALAMLCSLSLWYVTRYLTDKTQSKGHLWPFQLLISSEQHQTKLLRGDNCMFLAHRP